VRQSVAGGGYSTILSKWIAVPFLCFIFLYQAVKGNEPVFCVFVAVVFLCCGIWDKTVSYDVGENKLYIDGYISRRTTSLTNITDVREISIIRFSSIIKIEFEDEKDVGKQITFSVFSGGYWLMKGRTSSRPRAVEQLLNAVRQADAIAARRANIKIHG
jgi:hypothetical protein